MAAADPRDRLILELTRRLDEALTTIAALQARAAQQDARIAELEARLRQSSRNTSKPPSSDGPGVEKPGSEPSGKKRGGQPGHEPSRRELLGPERVDKFEDHWPDACGACQAKMPAGRVDVGAPARHQVTEVPRVRGVLTEHRMHLQACRCGHETRGSLPAGVPIGAFGPRLRATVALCAGRYRLSKRVMQELLRDLLGVEVGLGSVCNVERSVSRALAGPVEEARGFVRQQEVVHADETGWREEKRRAWLWTATTALVTVFLIAKNRGAAVAKQILGENFTGFLVVDRWAGYEWSDHRQLCWAHLLRDFQGFVDRGGTGGSIGEKLLAQTRQMFGLWHRVRDKSLQRTTFIRRMAPIERQICRLLRAASLRAEPKTAGMAREIWQRRHFLWVFVNNEDVAPTNNAAERAIRPAVLWRKGSFGTDTAEGSRFVERILSVVTTLRQQQRNVLDYLTEACLAQDAGLPASSILPVVA